MRAWVLLFFAAIPFGCSLLIETDELATEGAPSSGSDASSDVSVQTDGEAGTEDSGGDALSDAPDATLEADSPPLGFCESLSPAPTLCSDFDDGLFPAGWDDHDQWGKCVGLLDNGDSTSSPNSFSCTTPALVDDADQCATSLVKDFEQPQTSLRIEFHVLFGALDSPDWINLVTIDTNASNGSDSILLRVREGEGLVSESAKPDDAGFLYAGHPFPTPPVVGQWMHIVWTIDFTGADAFSNLTVNGITSGNDLHLKDFLSDPHIEIGIAYAQGASGPWSLRIDDVVVDVK